MKLIVDLQRPTGQSHCMGNSAAGVLELERIHRHIDDFDPLVHQRYSDARKLNREGQSRQRFLRVGNGVKALRRHRILPR